MEKQEKIDYVIRVFSFLMKRTVFPSFAFPGGGRAGKALAGCIESLESFFQGEPGEERMTDYCICQVYAISRFDRDYLRKWNATHSTAIRVDAVCGVLVHHIKKEYLPDRSFQKAQEVFVNHYHTYKIAPSYAILSQLFSNDYDAIELINTFREYNGEANPEVIVDMLEAYIKGVELQLVYTQVGKLYNQNTSASAPLWMIPCMSCIFNWKVRRRRL